MKKKTTKLQAVGTYSKRIGNKYKYNGIDTRIRCNYVYGP